MKKAAKTAVSHLKDRDVPRKIAGSRPAIAGRNRKSNSGAREHAGGPRVREQLSFYSRGQLLQPMQKSSTADDRNRILTRTEAGYKPLASVWYGEDAELLDQMLGFYPRERPKRILDATVNGGRFWRGGRHPVVGMDIEAKHRPDLVGNNTSMPFRDRIFDVVVYDPPHIPNQGRERISTRALVWSFDPRRRMDTVFPIHTRRSYAKPIVS
jgi:hypothetical protein